MKLYTLGFTQKSAEKFFSPISRLEIPLLIDVRLNNKSQLAGFTKGNDLKYFLKELCNCNYVHADIFAPTKEMMDQYKKKKGSWENYEDAYAALYRSRHMKDFFCERFLVYPSVLLLCSEPTPERCHRRLLAETLQKDIEGIEIIHI